MTLWQNLTLENFSLYRWQDASFFYSLIGRPARVWRKSSFLLQWGDALAALLISLFFALAPFVSNDLLGVLLIACAGFWILLTLSDEPQITGVSPIHLLVLLYWSIATTATALSPVKKAALIGLIKLTLYLLLFALLARVLRINRFRSWIIAVYLHVSLIVSVYGMRQWFFKAEALATWTDPESPLAKMTRVYSYLGNPNLLAGYLVPAVVFSIAAIFAWRGLGPKALAVTMAVLNGACLILTFSRGGWIGFVVSLGALALFLVYWFSVKLPTHWRTWALPGTLMSAAVLLILAVVFIEPVRDRVLSMFVGRGDSSNNFRINVWAAVQEMIRARPILGIGPGNNAFNKIYPLYMRPRFSALSAYSIWLEIAVETGFIGLSCFMWLLLVTFNQARLQLVRMRQAGNTEAYWLMAASATMIGMLAHGFVDTVWYRPEVSSLWWMMVAIIASYYIPPHRQPAFALSTAETSA
ncbi:MAG: IctB family putative bicarbonate transporter [Oscillatoriaceae bacterium SKW80]|nr:IctB family putative bicarbonate transporter [Oscillatoriaceae bacterium SKYG93]MCX8121606.1 IctB family putative bicarbonate transporter [Oscillatoriaceae bacterium SKW80]MDW8453914.1 IctB family putative bicarbonate transporter [Oscillatoriaceae cyanobacterium SKYGB_i_bin93]HIK28843.1 putative bicarbonate transporter, IctB family [Oscillatoriaceae cyanobacterium M7585_C2015_266]